MCPRWLYGEMDNTNNSTGAIPQAANIRQWQGCPWVQHGAELCGLSDHLPRWRLHGRVSQAVWHNSGDRHALPTAAQWNLPHTHTHTCKRNVALNFDTATFYTKIDSTCQTISNNKLAWEVKNALGTVKLASYLQQWQTHEIWGEGAAMIAE